MRGRSHKRLRIAARRTMCPPLHQRFLAFSTTIFAYVQTDGQQFSYHAQDYLIFSFAKVLPYRAAFTRGSVGDTIDGRSREGKFLRRVEAELVAGVGGQPTFWQQAKAHHHARGAGK